MCYLGIADTDLIVYVSYDDSTSLCQLGVSAHAGPCNLDQYGRPYTSQMNICTSFLPSSAADESYKRDIHVVTHEFGHIVIFSSFLWANFYNETSGGTIPLGEVYDTNDPMGDGRPYIISPKVKEVAQAHFNCPSLVGAPLEDNGFHFEDLLLHSENMGPLLQGSESYVSVFFLALMEDSGWYYVDYEWAKPYKWG